MPLLKQLIIAICCTTALHCSENKKTVSERLKSAQQTGNNHTNNSKVTSNEKAKKTHRIKNFTEIPVKRP